METCPVGVVVLDAATGAPRLVQPGGKAHRGGVDLARTPGRAAGRRDDLPARRRAHGDARRISGARRWCAPRRSCFRFRTGGASRTLLNATPIRSAEGEIERVVVTMQDLAPLEELDRLRAEFLGMVSHELRTPLAAIKGSTSTVAGRLADTGPGRGGAVLPGHRRAGGSHAGPDQRPAGRGTHRRGHAFHLTPSP